MSDHSTGSLYVILGAAAVLLALGAIGGALAVLLLT